VKDSKTSIHFWAASSFPIYFFFSGSRFIGRQNERPLQLVDVFQNAWWNIEGCQMIDSLGSQNLATLLGIEWVGLSLRKSVPATVCAPVLEIYKPFFRKLLRGLYFGTKVVSVFKTQI
jgi:hypothetical protein